ncbi:MAG: shikimate kinase [Gemmatimonadota bacterium]|nr:MAG: shikimate kinase [Gemmatimonadota bacterium]
MKRHLILVGLPGAGKSTVGRLVAASLGTPIQDVDALIEERLGISIKEIFASRGEAEFRELERAETVQLLLDPPAVIVPGGGWAAQPGNLESVVGKALTVYLATSPSTALARVGDVDTRPLLAGDDRAARFESLLAAREPYYERCDVTVPTDGRTVGEIAREVIELALECE